MKNPIAIINKIVTIAKLPNWNKDLLPNLANRQLINIPPKALVKLSEISIIVFF